MKLTDEKIQALPPRTKHYSVYDGWGMYIYVSPTGRKYWRYRYRIDNTENVFAAGEYVAPRPETAFQRKIRIASNFLTLEEARERRVLWRALVVQGLHPIDARRAGKL